MREIKFRAWHEQDKEMVNFKNEKLVNDQYQMQHLAHLINGDYGDALMQFTGLKDINGVDIYEGDIVKSHFYGEDYNGIAKIEYDDSSAAFVYDSAEQDAFVYGAENGQLEVVGNIHENPELLG